MSTRKFTLGILAGLCAITSWVALVAMPAGATELPDGRVYEMVTPPENYGAEVYQPREPANIPYTNTKTEYPFQAAADGNRVAFVAGPTVGGSEVSGLHGGNEYLGTRSPGGGWVQSNISPANHPSAVFEAFSSDLSTAFLDATEPLSPLAPGFGETPEYGGDYDVLYSTSTTGEDYLPFFTVKPPYRSMEKFRTAGTITQPEGFNGGTGGERADNARVLAFAGASADSTHLLFLANDALTGASEGRPAAEGGSAGHFESEDNLYESVDGQLRLVNVLPNGTTHTNATFGDGPNATLGEGPRFNHVISADGSRIFWTDLSTGHIYVRENGTTTVEISPAGHYQTATSDGSDVFFTNGDLYEYEVQSGHTVDLTPGVNVQRVVGASENGEYVYFLTTKNEFELWHNGVTTPIGAPLVGGAEVTPDGHNVVFASSNGGALGGHISVYDADTDTIYCASCGPTGSIGNLPVTNSENVYQPRWISADGSRVFFYSYESLVPQDTNGKNVDVYEWERPGAGSCSAASATGCIYLLSSGTSLDESYLIDASESGDDVFIVTRAKLVEADDNELYDLYDLRVDGYAPPAPPACTGSGCQGIPGAPPIFATPSSVTFEGVGNFPPASKAVKAKPKPKKKKGKHKKKSGKSKAKKSARGAKRSGSRGGRS